ncbi:aminotransferase class I/II-fold pyridoxal phosphate-dependent enzyme [Candidatus Pelagibacter bacterium]|nr:aminotransferase class I/II-fold pyridoxal phosphate-dependent enzyme [Candidatus Pelagibacter bacterium]|tara:strand:+ start:4855 stop:6003 length:1149 start_codon:yes stop_codon:yes gene_type:complete
MLTKFYGHQKIFKDDINEVIKSLNYDFITNGKYLDLFEKKISNKFNCKYAIVCNSGTSALYLALRSLNLTKKDYVIIPSINFLASANVIKLIESKIIFCDVDPTNGLVTPKILNEVILKANKKNIFPKVFIPQFHAGQCEDQKEIFKIAKKNKILIVEDACHALGSAYKNSAKEMIGSCKYANISTFSFHPVKNITSGEGGVVTTNDKNLYNKIKILVSHGIIKNKKIGFSYNIKIPSFNFRLSELNCALGYSQLKKLTNFNNIKKKLYQYYVDKLSGLSKIKIIKKTKYCDPHWHLFIILINFKNLSERSKLMKYLSKNNIGSQIHYKPVFKQELFKNDLKFNINGSEEYYKKCLSIPFHTNLTRKDIDFIVKKLRIYLNT